MLKYSVEKDGVTQGLLSTFLQCRQKAKWYLQGYSSKFVGMGLIYGTIGHAVLEKIYTDIQSRIIRSTPSEQIVHKYIKKVENLWLKENPRANKKSLEYLELSCLIAESTLPLYFQYWAKDIKEMKWIKLEHEFKIPYQTSKGDKTILRGKMDGVFTNPKNLWLFESKFKSRIEDDDLMDTLPMDFQSLFYLYALKRSGKTSPSGFLYNIVRRIGLKQGKNETILQFAQRCVEDIRERPEFYFIRREVSIGKEEMTQFEEELDSIISEFVSWVKGLDHYKNTNSCITKYGRCDYLNLCANRGFSSYIKRDKIFRELE